MIHADFLGVLFFTTVEGSCMKRLLLLGVVLSIVVVAGIASGVPITLNEVGVHNAATVNATIGAPINGAYDIYAGYYQLQINGTNTYNGFCVDPSWSPTTPQPYDLRAIDPDSNYAKAAYLFSQSSPSNAAAVQVAIWETVMGNGFKWNNPDHALASTVNKLLANQMTSSFDLSRYSIAVSPGNAASGYGIGFQDFIVDTPAPVPEPSTLLLLSAGFGYFALWRRRARM